MLLLLGLMLAGVGMMQAASHTVTASKVDATPATWTADNVSWTVTVDGEGVALKQSVTSGYAQIGTKNGPSTSITLSTSGITATITKIVLDCAAYNGLGTVDCTVGNAAFGKQGQSIPKWSSNAGGEVTFEGSATGAIELKMTNGTSGRAMYVKSITVTYEEAGEATKSEHGLSWSAESVSVTYGSEAYNLPTLSNANNLDVTYASSDKSVATIDENGAVTINNVNGTTTISATFDGDDNYKSGTVSYTLTVTKLVVVEDGVFDFENVDYGQEYTSEGNTYATEAFEATAGNVNILIDGKFRFWKTTKGEKTLRLYAKANSDKEGVTNAQLMLSVPAGYVITNINFGVAASSLIPDAGEVAGQQWNGIANTVVFEKTEGTSVNIPKITVTYTDKLTKEVTSYGWATYIAPVAVEFAAGDAYVVSDASVADGLSLQEVTAVPAGTPVLLSGAGEKTITVAAQSQSLAGNMLEVCDGEAIDGFYPYVLAKNGESACFKQWTGDMSTLKDRVVLWLDEPAAARTIYALGDEATAIQSVAAEQPVAEGIFSIGGLRVSQPQKGLYIVNGKKMIIK